MHEMGGPSSCPYYSYTALGLHLTHSSKGCTWGMRSAHIWACSVCVMARMARMAKVAVVAWKVVAEHGSCWVSSHHPGGFWMAMEAMGMSWDTCIFDKWSMYAPCTDHGRYISPLTHVDSLGHPLSNK